jgi:S-adenosylmethionine hydrolase
VLPPPNGIVTTLTDYGSADPYVGILKGSILKGHRRAQVLDLCHAVPAQDVEVGAFFLRAARGRFPDGTVHVGVVDPGVGTARRVLAVLAAGCYWIGPDNGLLDAVLRDPTAEVLAVDLDAVGIQPESRTFHGRDVFGPVAGLLAGGRFGFRALGRRIQDPSLMPVDPAPRVLFADRFGNLVTNVSQDEFEGRLARVRVAGQAVEWVGTYAEADGASPVALWNSYRTLEVAVSGGSAADALGIARGAPLELDLVTD